MHDVVAEFDDLLLPDKRLNERVRTFVRAAWNSPSPSLPQMFQDAAQLEGAYRLLNNRRVTADALLTPHAQKTVERASQASEVVVVHDTTNIETPYADAEDIGYLNTGEAGYRAHLSLALQVEPGRPARPLGVLGMQTDFRAQAPSYRVKKKRAGGGATAKAPDKAFLRWERGMEASSSALRGCTSVVHVADREADSYPLFCAAIRLGDGCVFRIRNDRRARRLDDADSNMIPDDWSSLAEIASNFQGQFQRTVPLSKRGDKSAPRAKKSHPPREARGAQLHFSAAQVELRRPQYLPAIAYPESISLWLVRV